MSTAATDVSDDLPINATPHTDQAEAGWTLGDMVMDERLQTPDDALVENDCLRHVMELLETMDARLQLMEDRVDFTERLLEKGTRKPPEVGPGDQPT